MKISKTSSGLIIGAVSSGLNPTKMSVKKKKSKTFQQTTISFNKHKTEYLSISIKHSICKSLFCLGTIELKIKGDKVNRKIVIDAKSANTKNLPENYARLIVTDGNKIIKNSKINLEKLSSKNIGKKYLLLSPLSKEQKELILSFKKPLNQIRSYYQKESKKRINRIMLSKGPISIKSKGCEVACHIAFTSAEILCCTGPSMPLCLVCIAAAEIDRQMCLDYCRS